MKQLSFSLSLCLSFFLLPATLRAALPSYDPINYPAGTLMAKVNADGSPWTAAGPATADPQVTAGSLIYPLLFPSIGNSVFIQNVNGPSARYNPFGTNSPVGVTSGTIYYSFLLQVRNLGTLGTSGGFLAGFNNSVGWQTTVPSTVLTRVLLRQTAAGGSYNVGLDKNSGTAANFVWDSHTFTVNDTVLIVGAYTFNPNPNDDLSQIWVDPDPTTFGAGAPPGASVQSATGTDVTGIFSFLFMQRNIAGVQPTQTSVDELRIGTTWASVTPPMPPAITQQPSSQSSPCGVSATFKVQASGGGTLTYQWLKNNAPIGGATSSNYTIVSVSSSSAGQYSCLVSNSSGGTTSGSGTLAVIDTTPPVVSCPADINISGTGSCDNGMPVTYSATANDNCDGALTPTCNPPSGATFAIGTTLVTCIATDSHGNTNGCAFNVTVHCPPEVRFGSSDLPPQNGVYISPDRWHQLYANGIIISNISHLQFTQSHPLPPPGGVIDHVFGSTVEFEQPPSGGGGGGPQVVPVGMRVSVPATVHVRVTDIGLQNGVQTYQNEMLQLDASGGGLPAGVMIRESPTLQSLGKTTVRQTLDGGGYMISSFFDIFTDISLDGGNTWTPSQGAAHVELHEDPTTVPPVPTPTPILPPRAGKYVSPEDYHALKKAGYVIKDVSHKFFTQSLMPPPPNTPPQTDTFDSQLDYQVSTDAGQTFTHGRSQSPVSVSVRHRSSEGPTQVYQTEMVSLGLSGGDLPAGVMVRESPTRRSEGGTAVTQISGTSQVGSFFDIWLEMSTDGGTSWTPMPDPARVTLASTSTEMPSPNPNLPPDNSEYISPQRFHQLYANGIIISNLSHQKFTQNQPPPPPGGSQTHNFGSTVQADVSLDGGNTFNHMSGSANVSVSVRSAMDVGNTRYFDTEMLSLNLTWPGGIMVRESPSKASLGRTSIRTVNNPAGGTTYYIDSFFDIFTEVSLDGGANWSPATSGPAEMVARPFVVPLTIACPANITVNASGPAGAVVTYPLPTVSGGCNNPPQTPACNPPSGSTFPVGTTVVSCSASDSCGQTAPCSFSVTVRPPAKQIFMPNPLLPPPTGLYISPDLFHRLAAQGIVIKDIRHRRFTQSQPPPPPGGSQIHQFGSEVDMQVSIDGGNTFNPASMPAQVSVRVSATGNDGTTSSYDTEMLQLDINGPGFRLRESPTLASTGKTTITPVAGGYMIGSFFDVFTEISIDNGQTWTPSDNAQHVELRADPTLVPPVPASTPLLPPRNDAYISPALYHALFAQGIVIKDIRHSFFTHSQPPPAPGQSQMHQFSSQIDAMVSTDGGNTYQSVRTAADVAVQVDGLGGGTFDTEMVQLNPQPFPPGPLAALRIRESPTLPSRGGTQIDQAPDGSYRIGSFFDIFIEASTDGGNTWMSAQSGPARVQLICDAPPVPFSNPNLPPAGQYVSPQQWHAYYANGVIISNVSHQRFTQQQPPPPPGATTTENFGSSLSFDISQDNGQTFQHLDNVPATVQVRVDSTLDDYGDTRFFDTEMVKMDLTLPNGVMVRESPSKASLGRTSIQTLPDGTYRIGSFFDIFTEVSTDGGAIWTEMLGRPAHMVVQTPPATPISITCPADITTPATGPAGAVVNFAPTGSGGCNPPPGVSCNPFWGTTFPVGTTTVNCTASDMCGSSATCTFHVTVTPKPTPQIFFPGPALLPPPTGVYISPDLFHRLAAQGIVIKDIRHRRFTQSEPPPPNGGVQVHIFGSDVDMQLSTDGGNTFHPASAPAQVQVRVSSTGVAADGSFSYDTEMLQLNISGGGLPNGVMVRESPTLASIGKTTVRQVAGGYMIGSFFDVFTEISTDGGASWTPVDQAQHVELRRDPALAPASVNPKPLLPPPTGAYISPALYHILLANGIQIKDIRHSFFTVSQDPPQPGQSQTHQFDSQIDLQASSDGGQTYTPVRATAAVSVQVSAVSDDGLYDTEMVSLDVTSIQGPWPVPWMIRESPTLPSRGGTQIDQAPDGSFRIHSFFDIFIEMSTDGGRNWTPAQGPAHVELTDNTPPKVEQTPNLPPLDGQYISPQKWHALYANGIIISNVSHQRFTQTQPPPPTKGSQTENFGSTISLDLSLNNGQSFQHVDNAQATVQVQVNWALDDGDTRYFNTEMLALSLQGLPGGVMVRESPTRASLGRTSIRSMPDGTYRIGSFFDIFPEVSTDNGATWSPAVSLPAHMVLAPTLPAFGVSCPADITTTATGPAGRVVTFTAFTIGGCDPVPPQLPATITCNPPSGSTFPVGTTTVTCTGQDPCGQTATCTFTVTVRPRPPVIFFPTPLLPPPNSVYITPQIYHQLYAQGIVIRNIRHRKFTQAVPPPPPGVVQTEQFNSEVDGEVSNDGGQTFTLFSGLAQCTVRVTGAGNDGTADNYDTEMLQLDLAMPNGVMLRESPTLQSKGQTSIRTAPGGYFIGSFFDIFTEISTDNGVSWTPAQQAGHVELRNDPANVPPVTGSTPLLPPIEDAYVPPPNYQALYGGNIIIKDIRNTLFGHSMPPPPPGGSQIEQLDSHIEAMISTDGGAHYSVYGFQKGMTIKVDNNGGGTLDTELLSTEATDPATGLKIRESPTLPSRGGTQIDQQSDGTYRIGSFFDVFTEVSIDGGATWLPSQGPAHMELICDVPPIPLPVPNLPPLNGQYISPQRWHALYAQGIIISNVIHRRFTQNQPPPPPGGNQNHAFDSEVIFSLSLDNGQTFRQVDGTASCLVGVASTSDDCGDTRFFDTEMLQLNLTGANGVMVRESPSKASLGRTSVRTMPDGTYAVASFFDINTEVSLDGGQTWLPSQSLPAHMALQPGGPPPILINCPADIAATAPNSSGVVVNFSATASGGCDPTVPAVICNPASGSTFPVGTTIVTCFASDSCGFATCSFKVVVTLARQPGVEIFFPKNVLPPPDGVYISPAQFHQLYAQGIIIRDIRHKRFIGDLASPPAPGTTATHTFNSSVEFELSMNNGQTWQRMLANAQCTVGMTASDVLNGVQFYDTEMLQLSLTSGGIMLRESPTLQSRGQTTVRTVPGGYLISSFFDINTEISLDGGASWLPAQNITRVQLRKDPTLLVPAVVPSNLLPPPNGHYITPALYHQLYQQGIIIKDVRHSGFTTALAPPTQPGQTNKHSFNSILDLYLSTDNGQTYHPVRASAKSMVSLSLATSPSVTTAPTLYDTEMTQLDVTGLPAGLLIRESPTLPSRGGTAIDRLPDGSYRIGSFFDIFTEISTDAGQSWTPSQGGPGGVQLQTKAPEQAETNPNIPPVGSAYTSPKDWHALYANGVIISNVSHERFTQSFPPPNPGVTDTHQFGSSISAMISLDGGHTWTKVTAPAAVETKVTPNPSFDQFNPDGSSVRYFDTEITKLMNPTNPLKPVTISDSSGQPLCYIRESPTRQSLGRTSIRQSAGPGVAPGGYHVSSFFDVFTDVSLDGNTWLESDTLAAAMSVRDCSQVPALTVTLSPDGTQATLTWSDNGGNFRVQCTDRLASDPNATQWRDVTGGSGVTVQVTAGKAQFYRLICP